MNRMKKMYLNQGLRKLTKNKITKKLGKRNKRGIWKVNGREKPMGLDGRWNVF